MVRREISDSQSKLIKKKFKMKGTSSHNNLIVNQKSSRKKVKMKGASSRNNRLGKRRPKNPRKNPPNRKIRFMHKGT